MATVSQIFSCVRHSVLLRDSSGLVSLVAQIFADHFVKALSQGELTPRNQTWVHASTETLEKLPIVLAGFVESVSNEETEDSSALKPKLVRASGARACSSLTAPASQRDLESAYVEALHRVAFCNSKMPPNLTGAYIDAVVASTDTCVSALNRLLGDDGWKVRVPLAAQFLAGLPETLCDDAVGQFCSTQWRFPTWARISQRHMMRFATTAVRACAVRIALAASPAVNSTAASVVSTTLKRWQSWCTLGREIVEFENAGDPERYTRLDRVPVEDPL